VFDVEDLVTLLVALNAQDHVTIRVPPEINFADYMVIISAKSLRHLKAMAADLKKTVCTTFTYCMMFYFIFYSFVAKAGLCNSFFMSFE